jgi:hypothetical protein
MPSKSNQIHKKLHKKKYKEWSPFPYKVRAFIPYKHRKTMGKYVFDTICEMSEKIDSDIAFTVSCS